MQHAIERILESALRLASARLREGEPLEPMLVLDGAQGDAVLRLSFASAAERGRLADKARLMATALQARAGACIFETCICAPGLPDTLAVVMVAAPCGGSTGAVAVFARDLAGGGLRPLETGLAGPRLAGTLAPLLDFLLPDEPSRGDVKRAWRQLEDMGVTIGSSRRALH